MRTIILLFTTLLIAIVSCKKKEVHPEPETPIEEGGTYVSATTPGSYWVYRRTTVDSSGNVTPTSSYDTVSVIGDSTINGEVYTVYRRTHPGEIYFFERDSNGYIVDQNGNIKFAYVDPLTVYYSANDAFFPGPNGNITLNTNRYCALEKQTINAAGQSFESYVNVSAYSDSAGGAVNVCGDLEVKHFDYRASGVGRIRWELAYFSNFVLCKYHYWELVDYYIAP